MCFFAINDSCLYSVYRYTTTSENISLHCAILFFTGIQENFDDRAYHLWLCICVMKIDIILSPLSGGVKADPIPQWDIKLFYVHLFLLCQACRKVGARFWQIRRRRQAGAACRITKGQLISKCLFEKIVWTKIPTKNLIDSALQTIFSKTF